MTSPSAEKVMKVSFSETGQMTYTMSQVPTRRLYHSVCNHIRAGKYPGQNDWWRIEPFDPIVRNRQDVIQSVRKHAIRQDVVILRYIHKRRTHQN